MKLEFVTLEQSVELFKKGLDIECLGAYYQHSDTKEIRLFTFGDKDFYKVGTKHWVWLTNAPLWQQAFKWFRERHNLFGFVDQPSIYPTGEIAKWTWGWNINHAHPRKEFDTYQEAQIDCVNQMLNKI